MHTIYIAADLTPVNVDHVAHANGLTMFTNHDDPPTLIMLTGVKQPFCRDVGFTNYTGANLI